jgi:hypothetical protein
MARARSAACASRPSACVSDFRSNSIRSPSDLPAHFLGRAMAEGARTRSQKQPQRAVRKAQRTRSRRTPMPSSPARPFRPQPERSTRRRVPRAVRPERGLASAPAAAPMAAAIAIHGKPASTGHAYFPKTTTAKSAIDVAIIAPSAPSADRAATELTGLSRRTPMSSGRRGSRCELALSGSSIACLCCVFMLTRSLGSGPSAA